MGIDGNLYVSTWQSYRVYKYTTQGKQIGVTKYEGFKRADSLAMDSAGHLLIADYSGQKINVYSPCGGLIETIVITSKLILDVEIGNDGTLIVADYHNNKVLLY